MNPEVTVLMSVYNGSKYLAEAIESILHQSYTDFEFLIINDGSTDLSEKIIKSYNDRRINYIKNNENIGLTRSLNKGLCLARGKYIARMDADDISMPDRFKEQVDFMEKNENVVACGTFIELFGIKTGKIKYPIKDKEIREKFIFNPPLAHPTAVSYTHLRAHET